MKKSVYLVPLFVCALSVAADGPAVTTGLVAYYPLNGSAADASGNGHDGAIVGSLQMTTDRFGNPNGAYHFSAGDNRIQLSGIPVDIAAGGLNTVSFWMKWDGTFYSPNDLGAYPFFWGGWEGNSGNAKAAVFLQANQSFYPPGVDTRLGLTAVAGHGETWGVGNPPLNDWVQVAAVFKNSNDLTEGELFINGQPVSESLLLAPGAPLTIASFVGTSPAIGGPNANTERYQFIGAIDDVAIYDRALSADEVRALYASAVPEGSAGVVAWLAVAGIVAVRRKKS